MVSLNRIVSWVTTAIWLRRSRVVTSRMSVPPMRTAPRCGIVKAQQQVGQGRLARAAGADQGHQLARLDREIDVVEHGLLAVREFHAFEADFGARGPERFGVSGSGMVFCVASKSKRVRWRRGPAQGVVQRVRFFSGRYIEKMERMTARKSADLGAGPAVRAR